MTIIPLDEHPPVRDVSFIVLMRLLREIWNHQPITYSEIVEKPSEPFSSVWKIDNRGMTRTRRYYYLNALKILELISSVNQAYHVTALGENVLITEKNVGNKSLEAETVDALRRVIINSEYVQKNFLSLFVGIPYRDPFVYGVPVSISPVPGEKTYKLYSAIWQDDLTLSRLQTQGIIWGLRQWCQSLNIIDEIFIRPQGDIQEKNINIIFPIDIDKTKSITTEQFHVLIEKYLIYGNNVFENTISISIPLLLYHFCAKEHIPLEKTKEILLEWAEKNKEFVFMESSSFPVLQAGRYRRGTTTISWRKQEDAYILSKGKYYSRLFVPEVLFK